MDEYKRFICNDCGEVFGYEEMGDYCECPSCNSTDTEEAWECPICGEWYNPMEMNGHTIWCCPECFQKAFNRDTFRRYATARYDDYDKLDVMEDFIMYEVFRIEEELKHSSLELKEHCLQMYDDLSKPDLHGVYAVDDLIKDYFDRVPDSYGNFTEWLVDEHRKAAKK